MHDEITQIADRLDDVSEQLAEVAIELLQGALADADTSEARSRLERSVTRARRATVKAASILRESTGAAGLHEDE